MGKDAYLYSKLSGTTVLTDIVGSDIYPNTVPPDVTEPYISWFQVGFNRNRIVRQSIESIKGVALTKDLCDTLNEAIYNTFDNSTQSLAVKSSDVKVENIEIVNHISSLYDDVNKNWFGVTDINITYWI